MNELMKQSTPKQVFSHRNGYIYKQHPRVTYPSDRMIDLLLVQGPLTKHFFHAYVWDSKTKDERSYRPNVIE